MYLVWSLLSLTKGVLDMINVTIVTLQHLNICISFLRPTSIHKHRHWTQPPSLTSCKKLALIQNIQKVLLYNYIIIESMFCLACF